MRHMRHLTEEGIDLVGKIVFHTLVYEFSSAEEAALFKKMLTIEVRDAWATTAPGANIVEVSRSVEDDDGNEIPDD